MILNLLFQILISWLFACCILRLFNIAVSATFTEIYRQPALLTDILGMLRISLTLRAELMAGKVLHHLIGLGFSLIYYIIWYYEFGEISLAISLAIGIIISLVRIISWTFLFEIIPSARLNYFKGYYLQLIFVHNIFTISALMIYRLIL